MGEVDTFRAAAITVQRAILERFPPGKERTAWLRWLPAQGPCAGVGRSRNRHFPVARRLVKGCLIAETGLRPKPEPRLCAEA